ncbi:MFS transporter [Streptomyces iranensis]|uniref:DHA1 family inner membrane transport protein n=1 Tax=Streptomyces iranensis TaxID=576784 RepID=A0A060ZBX7_9ACTN|nr:MFS transporter [Streptomyces iranensis]MBP2068713.1 DHA1 family inner membrane transport protein [Streptomyces iranensis]CDR01357.1 major facilitator superfamily MFS_1 [Streptomyces iranensis]
MDIRVTLDGRPVEATLNRSPAARDLATLLPLTLDLEDASGDLLVLGHIDTSSDRLARAERITVEPASGPPRSPYGKKSLMSPAAGPATGKLPFVVWVLAAGTFLMGTTEFVIAGLLPEIAGDLGVSVSHAGLLITAFAVGMIVGGPAMALATLRLPQRRTLVLALAVFALGHVVAVLSGSFAVVLTARVVTALATGAFWAVGFVIATAAAGPGNSTRAVGVMMGGLTLANVVGVPIGSFVGQYTGWRGPFWALAALAALASVSVGRFIPRTERWRGQVSVRAEVRALRQGRLWLALAAAVLIMGGVLATYTYITPLLTDRAGIATGAVPLVLVAFGVGALGGTAIGGRLGDRLPLATTITAAAATAVTLLVLIPLSNSPVAAVILVFLMALTGFTVNPVVTSLAVRFAGDAPTLTSALTTSAYNTGIAASSAIAGRALSSSLGLTGPALVGTVSAALTLLPLIVLALSGTTRPARIVARHTSATGPCKDETPAMNTH